MPCTICQHPKHQEIDQALVAGSATLAALSQQYNLSTSALHRHKAHLQAKVGRAKSKLVDYLQQNCIFWLSQALEMTCGPPRPPRLKATASWCSRPSPRAPASSISS